MMTYNEPNFGLNDFNAPNMMKDNDVLVNMLLMICFGKPGCYPYLPQLGLNLQRYFYDYEDAIDVRSIKSKIAVQCSLLTDLISSGDIDVKCVRDEDNKPTLLIVAPTTDQVSNNILVVGITTGASNNVIYNYEIMQASFA